MKENHMKYTNQRVEIMKFLSESRSHPTVEEIYDGVRKRLSRISRATVYSNLRMLSRNGLVQEVNIKGVSRFEPNLTPHHHIVCRNCGDIVDFESRELTDYSLKVIGRHGGFSVDSASTSFFGLCRKCKGGRQK